MNPDNGVKRLYCRAYQTGFRVAMPVLPYREPLILKTMRGLARFLERCGKTNVLVVTDPGIRALNLTAGMEKALTERGIECHIYDKTTPNPTFDNVREAAAMYELFRCDALIGFGGGSSIDCAKAVGAQVACPKKDISKHFPFLAERADAECNPLYPVPMLMTKEELAEMYYRVCGLASPQAARKGA